MPVIYLSDVVNCDIINKKNKIAIVKEKLKEYENKTLTRSNIGELRVLNDMLMEAQQDLDALEQQIVHIETGDSKQETW